MSRNDSKFIIDGGPAVYIPSEKGLSYEIFHAMNLHSKKTAVYNADSNASLTFETLKLRSVRMAQRFLERGLTKTDVVCSCSVLDENCTVPMLASLFAGCIYSSFEINQSIDSIKAILNFLQPKVLFIVNSKELIINDVVKSLNLTCEVVLWEDAKDRITLPKLIEPIEGEDSFQPIKVDDINDTIAICLTSGTTGLPKGVCLTHKSLLAQAVGIAYYWNIGNSIKVQGYSRQLEYNFQYILFLIAPMYWLTGLIFWIISILSGSARVISKNLIPKDFCRAVQKYQVNLTFLQPTQAYEIYASEEWKDVSTQSLLTLFLGGSKVSSQLLQKSRQVFPNAKVCSVYGQTECCGPTITYNFNNPEDLKLMETNLNSTGKTVIGTKYKVVNMYTDEILGPLKNGVLKLKSDILFAKGYYKSDTKMLDSEGWFDTKDLVYYDENFSFYVVDRVDDMIKYKVLNLSPYEIEKVLNKHPAIKECFVIGYPDEEHGELPMAVVVLEENINNVTEKDIFDFAAENLPDQYKLRGGVKFVKEILKTATGKIKKFEIKNLIIQNKI